MAKEKVLKDEKLKKVTGGVVCCTYTVKEDTTLAELASLLNCKQSDLKKLNNIEGTFIPKGSVITYPDN